LQLRRGPRHGWGPPRPGGAGGGSHGPGCGMVITPHLTLNSYQ